MELDIQPTIGRIAPRMEFWLQGAKYSGHRISESLRLIVVVFPFLTWHVVFSVTPQTMRWMPSTHTFSSMAAAAREGSATATVMRWGSGGGGGGQSGGLAAPLRRSSP